MHHIKNYLSECINVIIFQMIQDVLHKLENAMVKLTLHTAISLFNQQTSSYNNEPHQKLIICLNAYSKFHNIPHDTESPSQT